MAIFSYRATTREGAIVEGVIEAANEKTAIERLKDTGIIPLKVTAPREGINKKLFRRSLEKDVITFTTELSELLNAGLPLDRSLNILTEISESEEMRGIILSILRSIREGGSFSEALQQHPKVFSSLYVNMIRAGESGGVLGVVLDKLNEFLESVRELKEHLFSAMIYPVILGVTGGISVIILLTYVLPKFSSIFSELGKALPLPTQILLTFSDFLKSYWWIAFLLVTGGSLLFRNYVKTGKGRYNWDAFKLKMMGDVITKLETARFCRTLGTLLRSGVPLLQAIGNARDVLTNQVIASSIASVLKDVKEGKGIAGPLSNTNVFPPLALSMIKVGEETGQLEHMLIKVASTYDKSLKVAIKRFVGFAEPAMILGMGLIIGFIVVSMLMAIFSITDLPF